MTIALVGVVGWTVSASQNAWAFPKVAETTKASCATCHTSPAGGAALTEVGTKYKADPSIKVPTDVAGADYIGEKKCGMCHRPYAKAWEETPHAKAFALLETADAKTVAMMAEKLGVKVEGKASESKDCVPCHVVGYDLPGGYKAGAENAAQMTNVACEACHGPGSMHMKAAKADKKKMINGQVGEQMCRQCHTKEMSPDFDFAKYVAKGVHHVEKAGEK